MASALELCKDKHVSPAAGYETETLSAETTGAPAIEEKYSSWPANSRSFTVPPAHSQSACRYLVRVRRR